MQNLTMHRSDWLAIVLILGAAIASVVMIVFGANGCSPSVEQKVKNSAEAVTYAAELAQCRTEGRAAKADGGALAYMTAYEACAQKADAKHGITFAEGGAP